MAGPDKSAKISAVKSSNGWGGLCTSFMVLRTFLVNRLFSIPKFMIFRPHQYWKSTLEQSSTSVGRLLCRPRGSLAHQNDFPSPSKVFPVLNFSHDPFRYNQLMYICSPICSKTMPTLGNGSGLPTLDKGSVPR